MSAGMAAFGPGLAARVGPGAGERVLWLHGYTLDSSVWDELWAELPGWQHIGLDLPGHGASAPLARGASMGALAEQVGELALAQGVRHIVGLSFGSLLALAIGIRYPGAFATLSLGAPGLVGGPEEPATPGRYRELAMLYGRRGPGPWMTELWMRSPPDIFAGAAGRPELWARLAATVDRHPWAEMGSGAMRGMMAPAQGPAELARIQTPTALIVGDGEMPAFREAAATIAASVPDCTCSWLEGAGHLCMLERPGAAAALLATHLARATAQTI